MIEYDIYRLPVPRVGTHDHLFFLWIRNNNTIVVTDQLPPIPNLSFGRLYKSSTDATYNPKLSERIDIQFDDDDDNIIHRAKRRGIIQQIIREFTLAKISIIEEGYVVNHAEVMARYLDA